MTPEHTLESPPPAADPAGLFELAATSFREELNIERLVAASDERALFVARDLVLKRRVALRLHSRPDRRFANSCLDVAAPADDQASEAFLAPETRGGRPGEPASDIYTAGALLYYAVTGVAPAADPTTTRKPRDLRPACPQVIERMI